MSRGLLTGALALAALCAGCGAGPYGHSRVYAPLDAEEKATVHVEELDPVMAKRMPDKWVGHDVSFFGVVVARKDLGGQRAELVLSLRAREPRNLCESSAEDSCRVTVSDREFDRVRVTVAVASADDAAGPISIGGASLVRVVGKLEQRGDEQTVTARYYRHWPHGYYVTTKSAPFMRQ